YSGNGGYSLGNTVVSPNLKPEMTTSIEAGFDLDLSLYNASIGATVYKSNTVDQTLPVQVSTATGYSNMRVNVGEVQNKGIETYLRATFIERGDFSISGQVTYTLNRNKVLSLPDGDLILSSVGNNARILAKEGYPFPYLQVTEYNRTPEIG